MQHTDTYSRHWQSMQSYKLGKIVQICEMFACTTWPYVDHEGACDWYMTGVLVKRERELLMEIIS
jgi:hypothetical protein